MSLVGEMSKYTETWLHAGVLCSNIKEWIVCSDKESEGTLHIIWFYLYHFERHKIVFYVYISTDVNAKKGL